MKISPRAKRAFEHFAQCQDTQRLPRIEFAPSGASALEAFTSHESLGVLPPCREPELLSRALNGKEWNGLTCTIVAEDLVDGLATREEITTNYPPAVASEIFGKAKKIAMAKVGFVPQFVLP